MEIEDFIIGKFVEYTGVKPELIELNDTVSEHGLDSLDVVNIQLDMEDFLGVTLPDSKIQACQTPQDFINLAKEVKRGS